MNHDHVIPAPLKTIPVGAIIISPVHDVPPATVLLPVHITLLIAYFESPSKYGFTKVPLHIMPLDHE